MKNFLRKYWFFVILGAIIALWLFTSGAYARGASGISVRAKYGAKASIDFMRDTESVVLKLDDGVGLSIDAYGSTIVTLEKGPLALRLCCGQNNVSGSLSKVEYRQGDWYFRDAEDNSDFKKRWGGEPPKKKVDELRTLAYNAKTGERLMLALEATEDEQRKALEEKGLTPSEEQKIPNETLGDLEQASMIQEGCVIFQVAFLLVTVLYLVIAGPIWLVLRRRRHAKTAG